MVNKGKKSRGDKYSSDEEACHYTRLRSRILAPNYTRLAGGSDSKSEGDSDYSAIATLRLYESSRFEDKMAHMTGSSGEVNQRLETQECLILEEQKNLNELSILLLKMMEKYTEDESEKALDELPKDDGGKS